MTRILVVDDSAVDRRLAGGLLERPSWTIVYAGDGQEALQVAQAEPVDIIVTDLNMPEQDGLAVVERAKEEHPLVPVVLMTAKGSEEIALRALKAGAASYVPKKLLARDLVDVVERILEASGEQKSYRRLLGQLRSVTFVLQNDLEVLSSLVSYLNGVLGSSGLFPESACHQVSTALDEALTNAFYHGNLEVSSEIRDTDVCAFRDMANQRRAMPPYRDRRIRVTATVDALEARFVVKDEGPGFDVSQTPDPTHPENITQLSGRGVFLMKAFMDEVRYNDTGNEVTLRKRVQVTSAS